MSDFKAQLSLERSSREARPAIDPEDYIRMSHLMLELVNTYPGIPEGSAVRHTHDITGYRMSPIAAQLGLLLTDGQVVRQTGGGIMLCDKGVEILQTLDTLPDVGITT